MELQQAKIIVDTLHDPEVGDTKAKLYENYSGRGMFGETTTGVVTSFSPSFVKQQLRSLTQEIDAGEFDGDSLKAVEGDVDVYRTLLAMRIDNLGLDWIYY